MASVLLQRSYVHLASDHTEIVEVPFMKRQRSGGTIGDVEMFSDGQPRSVGGSYAEIDQVTYTSGPVLRMYRDKLYSWRGRDVMVRTPFFDRFWAQLHSISDTFDIDLDNDLVDQLTVVFLRVEDDL